MARLPGERISWEPFWFMGTIVHKEPCYCVVIKFYFAIQLNF